MPACSSPVGPRPVPSLLGPVGPSLSISLTARPVPSVPSRLSGLLGPSHAPRGPSLPLSGRPYGPLSGISPPLKTPRSASTGRLSSVRLSRPVPARLSRPSRPPRSGPRSPIRRVWPVSRPSVGVSARLPSHLLKSLAGIVYPLYHRIEACTHRVRHSHPFPFICKTTTGSCQFTILAGSFQYVGEPTSVRWAVSRPYPAD